MFRIARAATYAATALLVAFSATHDPSLAWEYDAAAAVAPIAEHGAASPDVLIDDPTALDLAPPSYDPSLSADIVEHAVAPVAEEGALPQPEERSRPGSSLAQLVSAYASAEVSDAEHDCLAGAVYFESKGEPLEGQLAVAEVILNRASSGKFPRSICGVVKQKSQFSFVRGGRIPAIPRSSEAWRKAVAIAHIAKRDLAEGGVGKAMFFHARYVSPRWRLTRVASIGNHIFYR